MDKKLMSDQEFIDEDDECEKVPPKLGEDKPELND